MEWTGREREPEPEVEVPRYLCDRCGGLAVVVGGRWAHAEAADAVFCALVFPRPRVVGSGGSE